MKELSPEDFIEWKRILVDVLREFHDICHKHGLTYYAVGGTAIGAVRHKGMIPWDDDIDVAMPRPDFDKFVEICHTTDLGNYELVDNVTTPGYYTTHPKFCNCNTTLVERWDYQFVMGLFLDIFPLDGASENADEAMEMVRQYRKNRMWSEALSSRTTFLQHLSLLLKPRELGRFVIKTVGFFARKPMKQYYLRKTERISRKYPFGSTSKVINYDGAYGIRELFDLEILNGEPITMPFEDVVIDMMPNYDAYLKGVYGDYMQLPPEEKRIPHHLKAFYNLKERVRVDFSKC